MDKFIRNCPDCFNVIIYKTEQYLKIAEKNHKRCKSCAIKSTITNERRLEMSSRISGDKNPMFGKYGERNSFFNRKHTEAAKIKMRNRDFSNYKTKEFRDKMSLLNIGNKNPMYGKSFYDIWVSKFGKKLADIKLLEYKKKQSENNRGMKNKMFGKASPVGSGNGWSGWYNGWFFRSLKELSYMVKIIERYGIEWECGELKKFTIAYFSKNGTVRTYRPDFILLNRYMVEIKPKKMWGCDSVVRKTKSAIKFCEKNNLVYKLTDPPILDNSEIMNLYHSGRLIFTEKYDKMLKQYNSTHLPPGTL